MATPKFAHVVLQTPQLPVMRDWYCALLDGHVVFEKGPLSFVTFDDEHHRIAFLQPPVPLDPKTPTSTGMHHVAYTFESLDDLLDRYTELKARGIEPRIPVQHGVTTSLYYRDPDGNHVELQVDNFATPDEATGYMEGPEYEANPVGVAFDPEKMIEARRTGSAVGELTTMTWAQAACPGLPDPITVLTS
jgi:catechol 2,3-dioxygenase-like lactoylglutathione lyase family enzyme